MVTEQLTVVPVPRVTVEPAISKMLVVEPSWSPASPMQAIGAVLANTVLTVMVKFITMEPVKVVLTGGGASSSNVSGWGMEWNIPVRGSRYPRMARFGIAFCPQSVAFRPRKHAESKSKVNSL
jgi:hypothetical protein